MDEYTRALALFFVSVKCQQLDECTRALALFFVSVKLSTDGNTLGH